MCLGEAEGPVRGLAPVIGVGSYLRVTVVVDAHEGWFEPVIG